MRGHRFLDPRLLTSVLVGLFTVVSAVYSIATYAPRGGDTAWYVGVAEGFLHGLMPHETGVPFPYGRPPGYPAFLSLIFLVSGGTNVFLAGLVNVILFGITLLACGRLAEILIPEERWFPPLAVALAGIDPRAVKSASLVLSDHPATLLTVVLVGLLARCVSESPPRRVLALIAVVSALLMHLRMDLAAIVVAGIAYAAWRLRRPQRTALRLLGAVAFSFVLCLPWSLWVSSQVGSVVFLADTDQLATSHRGWRQFASTFHVPDHLQHFRILQEPSRVPQVFKEPQAYASNQTRHEAFRLFTLVEEGRHAGVDPAVDQAFSELAFARRREQPIKSLLGLPVLRAMRSWFFINPTGERSAWVNAPLALVYFCSSVAVGLGFLAALWAPFSRNVGLSVLGAVVLVRTFSILGFVYWATGLAVYEERYLWPVRPIAAVLAAAAIGRCLAYLRRRWDGSGP